MPENVQLLVVAIALLGFWLIVMRPARNARRRQIDLQRGLEPGARVVIAAGIFGTVRSLTDGPDGVVELEVSPGTVITVARQAVVRRLDEPSDDAAHAAPTHDKIEE